MIQRNPPGIMLYFDLIDSLQCLSPAEQGALLMAMLRYARDGTEPQLPVGPQVLWGLLRNRIDRDLEHYRHVIDSRRLAAQKRWSKASEDELDANGYT